MPLEERELDAFIDQNLFGHDVAWVLWGGGKVLARKGQRDIGIPVTVPGYHVRISDAWKVVEELRERGISICLTSNVDLDPKANNSPELIALKDQKYHVGIWDSRSQRFGSSVYGKTAPEAICKAAASILEKSS